MDWRPTLMVRPVHNPFFRDERRVFMAIVNVPWYGGDKITYGTNFRTFLPTMPIFAANIKDAPIGRPTM